MRKSLLATLALLPLCGFTAAALADDPDPEQVVNAFEKATGVHKGQRRNHIKGVCVTGSFIGTKEASALSISPLFSGKSVPAIGRFSVAGPNPGVSDASHDPRGFGLQFTLPKDEVQQTAMLNVPVFIVATPQDFYSLLTLGAPDPATGKPDPARAPAFFAAHPETGAFLGWVKTHNPPPSYGNAAFYSLHAFKFIGPDKAEHWVRWRFVPKAGEKFMSEAELAKAPVDFLDTALEGQLRKAPLQWDMIVTLADKGDSIDNPTIAWPAGRKEIKAGTLTLTKGGKDAAGSCDDVNFDPNVMANGIDVSPDPVLAYRSQAYAVSYSRRMLEKGSN